MRMTILQILAFEAAWFACVLGAAAGRPLLGPIVVAGVTAWRLALERERGRALALLAAAAVLGIVLDGALTAAGVLRFPDAAAVGWPVPIWMVALWINFALMLGTLEWLTRRRAATALLGAAGGVVSYWAGARLGAVTLAPTEAAALAVVAVEWGVALTVLLRLRRQIYAVPGAARREDAAREVSS